MCPSLKKGGWEARDLLSMDFCLSLSPPDRDSSITKDLGKSEAGVLWPLQSSPGPVQWEGLNTCF